MATWLWILIIAAIIAGAFGIVWLALIGAARADDMEGTR